jgi:hypothetical protein
MVLCEWDAPEGDPGQSCCLLVSYRRLSAQFQFSLSADTLDSRVSISMVGRVEIVYDIV